jgi:hypothetical protein
LTVRAAPRDRGAIAASGGWKGREPASASRGALAEIHDALSRGDAASVEAVALVREMIVEIRVIPRGKGEPMGLEIVGDLAALMATERDANAAIAPMVAGARNHRCRASPDHIPFRLAA